MRFARLHPHQLAGHLANLDFWLDEVRHAFSLLDGYHHRLERLKRAQTDHAARMAVEAARLHRVPDAGLKEARRGLIDAAYCFLIRCHKSGLLPQKQLRTACDRLGIGVDLRDLTP